MTLQGTGEEWKAMDETRGGYRPDETLISAAKANIEKIRKRDVTLRVTDRNGKPLANQTVEVVQTKSSFAWGDNLWGLDTMYRFGEFNQDRAKYWKLRFTEMLNAANALCYWTERPRNDGPKTEDIQGDPQMEGFAACVDWANSEKMFVKGHPLFWSIQKCVPDWVKRYDYETQMKFAEVRIRNIVARFKGKVTYWDAVNEPMWEPAFKNLAQRNWPHVDPISDIADYIEPVLRWCRDEDPDACFVVNDYGMEQNKGQEKAGPTAADGTVVTAAFQRKRFVALMKELIARGSPPSAVGLQSHTGGWLDHAVQIEVYDEIASSGLPVHITEFWADAKHLEKAGVPEDVIQQTTADYITNYMTVAYGHPAIEAFFFWGLMGRAIKWRERSSHDLTVIYDRVKDLLKRQWMTRETLKTDGEGVVKFRGFFGDYALRHVMSGKTSTGVMFNVNPHDTGVLTLKAALAGLTK